MLQILYTVLTLLDGCSSSFLRQVPESILKTTDKEYLKQCKKIVGDDSIPVELLGVSKWVINEIVAEYCSDGNM